MEMWGFFFFTKHKLLVYISAVIITNATAPKKKTPSSPSTQKYAYLNVTLIGCLSFTVQNDVLYVPSLTQSSAEG